MRVAWGKRQKIVASVMAIGALLLGGILWVTFAPVNNPQAPDGPTEACVGFTNAKLDQHFAGNNQGMDGLSWDTAYVFKDLIVEKHGWSFYYTNRFVIISNCTFSHVVDHGLEFDHAQHVRVQRSTFLNATTGISLGNVNDILIANTSFTGNGKALRVDGASFTSITNNTFAGNTLAIKCLPFTSNVTFLGNHFTGNTITAEEAPGCANHWFQGGIGNYYADYFTLFPQATLDGDNPALAGLCDPSDGQVFVGSAGYPVSNRSTDQCPLVFVPITPPGVTVISPLPGMVIGNASGGFEVSIAGRYVVAAWYTLGGCPNNYSLGISLPIKGSAVATGTINQTAWEAAPDGDVPLTFHARSITGATGVATVTITRDTLPPVISITSPTNASAHRLPPSYSLAITELHVAALSCSVSGLSLPVAQNGTIPAAGWDAAPQGTVAIQFTVIDAGNNLATAGVMVYKDGLCPIITFTGISQHQPVGPTPPVISLSVIDNFTSVASDAYYCVGNDPFHNPLALSGGIGGSKIVTFAVNASEWLSLPEGHVSIVVTCADTLGNVGSEDLVLELDRSAPVIHVLAPLSEMAVGETPGYFALLVNDSHPTGDIWWSFDGGATQHPVTTWTGAGWAGYFTPEEWGRHFLAGEILRISFFARDALGNVGRTDITVRCVASNPARDPLAAFLYEPATWMLAAIVVLLGVLVHAHHDQTKKLEARLH